MNDDPLKEKNVFEQIYDVIIGKHAKQGLTEEQSQRVALWAIRDLILKDQKKTLYHHVSFTVAVVIQALAQTGAVETPFDNKQIGITSIISSTNIETALTLGINLGGSQILESVYMAERGGLAVAFKEPYPIGKDNPLYWAFAANAAGGNATLNMSLILNMDAEDI